MLKVRPKAPLSIKHSTFSNMINSPHEKHKYTALFCQAALRALSPGAFSCKGLTELLTLLSCFVSKEMPFQHPYFTAQNPTSTPNNQHAKMCNRTTTLHTMRTTSRPLISTDLITVHSPTDLPLLKAQQTSRLYRPASTKGDITSRISKFGPKS